QLRGVLNRAIRFTASAQTKRGGWGYVTAAAGNDFDEGATTAVQFQSLGAARAAGIPIPTTVPKAAITYLENATTPPGGAIYSLVSGAGTNEGRPALTVAGIAAAFDAGMHDDPLCKKWLQFSARQTILTQPATRGEQDEFGMFYAAQVMHVLGDDGF